MINTQCKSAKIQPEISIRIDKKDMINQLRAMTDNFIQLIFEPYNKKVIYLKDRTHLNCMQTKE